MSTPSKRLLNKLDLAYPVFSTYAEKIWQSPSVRDLYPIYLKTMYMIVRSAVPLMENALIQARKRGPNDEVAVALASYLAHHVKEEIGHDKWLLEDIEATGSDPDELTSHIPSPRIAAFVGAQYYWLYHYHPVSILGHIVVMEGYHPPIGFANRLHELTGYPIDAFRAIARHEVLDIRHKSELCEVIDSLPLTEEHEKMLSISALHSIEAGIDVLAEIHKEIPNHPNSHHEM